MCSIISHHHPKLHTRVRRHNICLGFIHRQYSFSLCGELWRVWRCGTKRACPSHFHEEKITGFTRECMVGIYLAQETVSKIGKIKRFRAVCKTRPITQRINHTISLHNCKCSGVWCWRGINCVESRRIIRCLRGLCRCCFEGVGTVVFYEDRIVFTFWDCERYFKLEIRRGCIHFRIENYIPSINRLYRTSALSIALCRFCILASTCCACGGLSIWNTFDIWPSMSFVFSDVEIIQV